MPTSQIIIHLSLLFLTAIVFGFIAKKLKQPVILGYLIGGMIIGSITGIGKNFRGEIALFAELGVALLMFLLGIEFSFRRFRRVGVAVILGGTIQILGTILAGVLLFHFLGMDFYSALFLGAVFSLSSTVVVVRILSEQGLLSTIPGELSLGWLLLQDLAVLPMIIILPALSVSYNQLSRTHGLTVFGWTVIQGILFLLAILLLGKYLVSFVLDQIAKTNSRELLLLSSFAICLIFAGLTQSFNLSFAFGALVSGILVSRTKELQAVFSEVRPLRDLFSSIFFVSLGFLINFTFILHSLPLIILLVVLVIILKFLIVFGLTFSFGFHSKVAFLTAVSLIQVSEFAFILGQLGLSQRIISESLYSLILSVSLITIVFTPPLIKNSSYLYNKLYPCGKKFKFLRDIFEKNDRNFPEKDLLMENRVILVGYGRVGSYIGRALAMEKIPFIVVDYNRQLIDQLIEKNIQAIYGDPANLEVLSFVKVQKAKALVITVPDLETQELVVVNALALNKKLRIYCRAHYEEDQNILKSLGVFEVIQPEFEASLTLIHKLLSGLGVSSQEIDRKVLKLKIAHNKLI